MSKRIIKAIFLILGFSTMLFCLIHTTSYNSYGQNVTNPNTGLSYQSIQSAIDAPQTLNGHILLASSGTFTENVFINKSITIRGAGKDSTTLQASNSNLNVISVTANNVTIKGLTIKNATGSGTAGIRLQSVSNVTIDSCTITNNFRGVMLLSASDNIISNCNITSNIERGIVLFSSSNRNKIIKNIVANTVGGVGDWTGNGINTGDQSSSSTIIEENIIYGNAHAGIIGYAGSNNTQIRRNYIYSNQGAGIHFGWSTECVFEDNNIYNNGDGITFDTAPNNICKGNNINNNIGHGIGLWGLGQSNIIIENNIVNKNGTCGIDFGSSTRNSIIRFNTVSENQIGVRINHNPSYANYGNKIYNNNFISNTTQAIDNSPEADYWDNGLPEGGNHWDNWTTPDFNNDGFVDNPFLINGGYSQDNYPLVKPYGEQASDTLQFSDQLQLSSDGYRPDIAFDKKFSSLYVVYEGWRDIYPEIFITKSSDNGKTFSTPIAVTNQTAGTIERPAIAIDTSGNIHIVYRDAGYFIAYCKSTDGGNTFSTPVRISDAPSSSIDRSNIACFGDNVYVVWRYDDTDYRIYFDRSTNGSQFGTDLQINDISTGTRGSPSIAIGSDETIYVSWMDGNKIRLAKSSNQGVSFTSSVRVDDNESIFSCNRPSITTIGKDTVFVVWEDYRNVISQIRFSISTDGGSTFEESKNVADSSGDFEQLYPKITRGNNNVIHCVWQDGRNANNNMDIFYAYLLQNGNSFSKNLKVNSTPGKTGYGHKYPAIAFGNNIIFTTWQGSTEGISGWQINFSRAKFVPLPITIVQDIKSNIPDKFILYQNYPNPFNPVTKIEYDIPAHSHVVLNVYNILGEEVATLVNQEQPAGKYIIDFQSKDFSSGVYLYRLVSGKYTETKKLLLLK